MHIWRYNLQFNLTKQRYAHFDYVDTTLFLLLITGMFCSETRLQSTFVAPWSEVIDAWHAKKSNFKYGVGPLDSNKAVYSYILVCIETPLTSVICNMF